MFRVQALCLVLLVPVMAQAQVIKVISGEHADFTRLVLTLPSPQEWRLGRTDQGYEVELLGGQNRYDLANAFDLIPRDRVNGLFADPVTGRLQLTIGCACHAIPFQLNARTIVIDIRDGAAPETSVFESNLNGQSLPPLQDRAAAQLRPRLRPPPADDSLSYDWLTITPEPAAPFSLSVPTLPNLETDAIREELVAQLAAGAARSVVDLALPEGTAKEDVETSLEALPQVRINDTVGLRADATQNLDLTPDGGTCTPDEELDLNQWGDPESGTDQLSGLYTGLVGEFDKPQPDVLKAAVKRYLFLGFGAEARALLAAFGPDIEGAGLLTEMSHILDGDIPQQKQSFAGMDGCDTAAAFWAFLSTETPLDSAVNVDAVKRSFSALPAHLRLQLGPATAEKLLAMGRPADAMEIRKAMGRTNAEDGRAAALVDAKIMLDSGNADQALEQVVDVLQDPGQLRVEALVQLVDTQIAAQVPVDAETADSLAAVIEEFEGHSYQPDIKRAYALALAGSGQFAAALAAQDPTGQAAPQIWELLSRQGSDDDILALAIGPPAGKIPAESAERIATRLVDLGFPQSAAAWRDTVSADPSPQADSAPTAEPPMADLVEQSPAPTESAAPGPAEGDLVEVDTPVADQAPTPMAEPEPADLARWDQNWANLARLDEGPWGQLATELAAPEAATGGASLAAASKALADSEATRSLIEQILQNAPESVTQP